MKRTLAVLIAVLVAVGSLGETCPVSTWPLRDLVAQAHHVVLGRVAKIHDVAGVPVAEVEPIHVAKGQPGARFFHPVEQSWPGVEEPEEGAPVLLFLIPDNRFQQPRAFWRAVDRLRGSDPFYDVATAGLLVVTGGKGNEQVAASHLELPADVPITTGEADGDEDPPRQAQVAAILLAIESMLEDDMGPVGEESSTIAPR